MASPISFLLQPSDTVSLGVVDITDKGADTALADNAALINSAILEAAASNYAVYIPRGTFRIKSQLTPLSNTKIIGDGPGLSIIYTDGNFRPIVCDSVTNVSLQKFKLTFAFDVAFGSQTGLRFVNSSDCYYSDIVIDTPSLNGIEVASSSRIRGARVNIFGAHTFGMFYYDSLDCVDEDFYIYQPGSFGHEFKNSKRCYSYRLKLIEPLGEYGLTTWTGFGTPPELIGSRLCEDCGWIDVYVKGTATSKNLCYINAAQKCFIRGGVLDLDPATVWAAISLGGTFFYNEGAAIAGDVVNGNASVTNVTNVSRLTIGDRIHIADSLKNYTISNIVGTTVTLDSNADLTRVAAVIGFVANCHDTSFEKLTIRGTRAWGSNTPAATDNINIGAATIGDKILGIVLTNVRSENAGRFGMTVTNAEVTVNRGSSRYSKDREMSLSAGAEVTANSVSFANKAVLASTYGVVLSGGAVFRDNHCTFDTFDISAITATTANDVVQSVGGEVRNVKTLPINLQSKSMVVGKKFYNNRVGAGGFNGSIVVNGSDNTVIAGEFDPGASTSFDCHVKELAPATGNVYVFPIGSNFNNPVILAAGSSSIRIDNTGVVPPAVTKVARNSFAAPKPGQTVYQSDNTPGIRWYDNGAWVKPTTTADP
jgi:hypothetical protein